MERMDVRLTISFSFEEADFLNKRAEELQASRSYVVRQALREAQRALCPVRSEQKKTPSDS